MKCNTLTDLEISTLSFTDLMKLHRERKPYKLDNAVSKHRANKRLSQRRKLKKHLQEITKQPHD